MAINIQLESGKALRLTDEVIIVGRGSHCAIRFADDLRVQAEHVTLRKLGDRWLAEALGDAEIQAGTSPPSRMVWLRPGDMLRLSASGPVLLFEPAETAENFVGKATAGERAWGDALATREPEAIVRPVLERSTRVVAEHSSSAAVVASVPWGLPGDSSGPAEMAEPVAETPQAGSTGLAVLGAYWQAWWESACAWCKSIRDRMDGD